MISKKVFVANTDELTKKWIRENVSNCFLGIKCNKLLRSLNLSILMRFM